MLQFSSSSIDIIRQKSPRLQYLENPHLADQLGFGEEFHQKPKPKPKPGNDSIAIYRYLDYEFYAKIVIGHPGQTMNVALDTAWTLSWILSEKCQFAKDGAPYIANEGKYNYTGFYSYEHMSVAHSNITGFRFIEMVSVPWTFLFSKTDGVLGLGIRNPNDHLNEPFFYALHRQNNITNFLFSVYLNRITIKSDQNSSDITTLCPNGCKGISDTSATRIIGPEDDVDKIHTLIKAQKFPVGGIWTVSCSTVNKLPEISFVLGGQPFKLKGPNYVIRVNIILSFEICRHPNTSPLGANIWVLGGAFLSQYYSIYDLDNKVIGFVRAA
nr:unnamed protein product [Callosobruchus analis]